MLNCLKSSKKNARSVQGDRLGNNFFSWNYMEQLSAQIKEHVVKSGQKR